MSQMNGAGVEGDRQLWIGITTRRGDAEWVQKNTRNYVAMVRDAGAEPIILSPDTPAVLPDGRTFTPDAQGRVGTAGARRPRRLDPVGRRRRPPALLRPACWPAPNPSRSTCCATNWKLSWPRRPWRRTCRSLASAAAARSSTWRPAAAWSSTLAATARPKGGPTNFHDVAIAPGSRLHAIVGDGTLPGQHLSPPGPGRPGVGADLCAGGLRPTRHVAGRSLRESVPPLGPRRAVAPRAPL